MEDHDRVSQASVVTISSFPVRKEGDDKVQTFGKRCRAARRDPNCPVVIRGWLNKKDSSGLKLWKRRWFVLSNYCLFYYKDSREESVLGSIPLPSYNILFCTPRECKNRKNTFKVVHQGMRSYFFSADTQEDMLGWVRALSQSACMESDGSINRRCSSYQDFTQIGGSSESVELIHSPSLGDGLSHNPAHHHRSQKDPSQLTGGRMGTPHSEHRGRRSGRQSPSPKTPSPREYSRKRAYVPNQDEDALPFFSGLHTPPRPGEFMGTGSLTPRGQLGSRPHTPVGRVDIRPQGDLTMMAQCYAPVSPKLEYKSTPHTPVTERWTNISQPTPTYSSLHHIPSGRRTLSKSYSTGANTDLLPPLPPSRGPHPPHPPHHHHHHRHMSICLLPPAMAPKPEVFKEPPPVLSVESDADAVLTRLCGCDKLLQSLSIELAQLQVDKDSVQCALEMTRLQLEDWRSQGLRGQEGAMTQKALLQEELVTIRARMCDVSLEMERVWCQYERMESELSVFRSHLQHICNFGMPQEQSHAQRELWMMEDILAGLKVNRDHFRVLLGLQRPQVPNSAFLKTPSQPGSPGSPTERLQSGYPLEVEPEPPARPPLPQGLQEVNERREQEHMRVESNYEHIYSGPAEPLHRRGQSQPDLHDERTHKDTSEFRESQSQSSSRWTTPDSTFKKVRMSEEEQLERMKRNQERLANKRKVPLPSPAGHTQCLSSEPTEEVPFPLRVTRVVTAVLPSTLIARRVSVEDPPPELVNPLPEQIPQEMQQRLSDQSRNLHHKTPRRPPLETPNANSSWPQAETVQEVSAQRLDQNLQDQVSERRDQPPHGHGRAQHHVHNPSRSSREDPNAEPELAPLRALRGRPRAALGNGAGTSESRVRGEDEEHVSSRGREPGDSEEKAEGRPTRLLTSDLDPDLFLTPEQREAKLRRVERIRERVIRSAVRESTVAPCNGPIRWERRERRDPQRAHPTQTSDAARKRRETSDSEHHDNCGSCYYCDRGVLQASGTEEPRAQRRTSPIEGDCGDRHVAGCDGHFGNKTQHKEESSRKGIMKRKKKSSLSSKPAYQRDADHRLMMSEVEREGDQEEVSDHQERARSSSINLRTEWFLSTSQWQGFIPLQNHGIGPLCDEDAPIDDPPLPCRDTGTDSNEDCSSVSQSLAKIMDNHSLFYKIACDINLSDNEITMTDGASNVQVFANQEEVAKELTNEVLRTEEVTYSVVKATKQHRESPGCHGTSATTCNGNITTANEKPESPSKDRDTPTAASDEEKECASVEPVHELCIYEEILDNGGPFEPKGEDASQDIQLKVEEEGSCSAPEVIGPVMSEQNHDHVTGETRNAEMGGDEPAKAIADQGVPVEAKEIGRNLDVKTEDAKLRQGLRSNTVPKCKTNSIYEGGMAHRSASFGRGRVTVLHTSL